MSNEMADENTPLLDVEQAPDRRLSRLIQKDDAASSIVKSHVSVEEQAMAGSTVGERLAYNDYTTIDWLHDLVSISCSAPIPSTHKSLQSIRSKTHTASATSTTRKISKAKPSPSSTPPLAG